MNCVEKNILPTKKTKRLSHGVRGPIAPKHVSLEKEQEQGTVRQIFVAVNLRKLRTVAIKIALNGQVN